jgi:alkyl hydroperoxide reductase subunit AhpC
MRRKIIWWLYLYAIILFSSAISSDSSSVIGAPVPLFAMSNVNSQTGVPCTLRLADHFSSDSQHAVILAFFAEWCAPCRLELPFLQHCADSLASQGLRLITASLDPLYIKKQRQAVKDMKLTCPIVHDRYAVLARRLGFAKTLPYTVFIDRKGFIKEVSTGYETAGNESILNKIQAILGRMPENAVKPNGSTVTAGNPEGSAATK